MSKKVGNWKKVVVGGILSASVGLGFWASQAFYTVTSVTDGDTFVTKEKQYIRLDSVNAPELDSCLGLEAKSELEKLVLNKKVFLKVTYTNGSRLIASAYTLDGNVGEMMLKKGLATFADKGTQKGNGLLETANIARSKKLGVYSLTCTQSENLANPKCPIKGNVNDSDRVYHYPGCKLYNSTLVQLHLGDKWFCTENEALKAGFVMGKDCL
jgi:micrococcal nuclease